MHGLPNLKIWGNVRVGKLKKVKELESRNDLGWTRWMNLTKMCLIENLQLWSTRKEKCWKTYKRWNDQDDFRAYHNKQCDVIL